MAKAKKSGYVAWVNKQSWLTKLILFFPMWGWLFGAIYRLFSFKSIVGVVVTILWFVGGFFGIGAIIDFVSVILFKKPVFLTDL